MTTQERFNNIKENLLHLSNNPRVSRLCKYFDPYYDDEEVLFGFTSRTKKELDNEIMKYAEEHPVP